MALPEDQLLVILQTILGELEQQRDLLTLLEARGLFTRADVMEVTLAYQAKVALRRAPRPITGGEFLEILQPPPPPS